MGVLHDDVRQVGVPAAARALCTLSRIDYEDAFFVENSSAPGWTGEQWVSAMLKEAPMTVRTKLSLGWSAIGMVPSVGRRSVLGWQIRASTLDFTLLGRASLIGMPGELLFKPERDGLLFATFVQHNNRLARAIWAATEPQHVPIVRDLLKQPGRRLATV